MGRFIDLQGERGEDEVEKEESEGEGEEEEEEMRREKREGEEKERKGSLSHPSLTRLANSDSGSSNATMTGRRQSARGCNNPTRRWGPGQV